MDPNTAKSLSRVWPVPGRGDSSLVVVKTNGRGSYYFHNTCMVAHVVLGPWLSSYQLRSDMQHNPVSNPANICQELRASLSFLAPRPEATRNLSPGCSTLTQVLRLRCALHISTFLTWSETVHFREAVSSHVYSRRTYLSGCQCANRRSLANARTMISNKQTNQ